MLHQMRLIQQRMPEHYFIHSPFKTGIDFKITLSIHKLKVHLSGDVE